MVGTEAETNQVVGIEKLKRLRDRRWEPGLAEPAAIGELQAALPAIIEVWEQAEDDRLRLKAMNDVYIEISNKLDAALEDRDRLRAAVELLQEAWTESWDCSRDPGHTVMNEAMAKVAALEDRDG